MPRETEQQIFQRLDELDKRLDELERNRLEKTASQKERARLIATVQKLLSFTLAALTILNILGFIKLDVNSDNTDKTSNQFHNTHLVS